jgi:hypothetical protein
MWLLLRMRVLMRMMLSRKLEIIVLLLLIHIRVMHDVLSLGTLRRGCLLAFCGGISVGIEGVVL